MGLGRPADTMALHTGPLIGERKEGPTAWLRSQRMKNFINKNTVAVPTVYEIPTLVERNAAWNQSELVKNFMAIKGHLISIVMKSEATVNICMGNNGHRAKY